MADRKLMFSRGFPTNRISLVVPSTGQRIVMRETTVTEMKSLAKTLIDNYQRKNMHIVYDAITDYLQSMMLTDGVDVRNGFTEYDRLYALMMFFQLSFYREPTTFKCPHCEVEVNYRYDMGAYLKGMDNAFIEDQHVEIHYKMKTYAFDIGWPKVATMSRLMEWFYTELGDVTDEMERTQYGINFVLAFVKRISVKDELGYGRDAAEVDLENALSQDSFSQNIECLNALPSMVMFDENEGLFQKITGYFINRLENCFHYETCPQCHHQTEYGIPQSSLFLGLFYGSMRSFYGFIVQVECLMAYRYGCCIFDKEDHMTFNDLSTLVHQLSATEEKSQKERQNIGKDNLSKGLFWIREILNTLVFPEDRKKGR